MSRYRINQMTVVLLLKLLVIQAVVTRSMILDVVELYKISDIKRQSFA